MVELSIFKIIDMINEHKRMEWIKTTDKLPDVDREILYTDSKIVYKGFYGYLGPFEKEKGLGFVDAESWDTGTGFSDFDKDISHWMYLPNLPSDGNG